MRVLQSFTRERRRAARTSAEVSDRYRASNMQTVVLNGIYFPVVDFLSSAATAVVLGYGGWLAFNGEVSIGTLVAFLGYLTNFFDPVQQLSQLYNTFLSAVAALDKITDLLDEEPEVRRPADADRARARSRADVAFEDVRFAYGRGPEVLHGIDLDVAGRDDRRARRPHRRRASRRSRSCSPASTTRPRAAITIDGVDLRDVTQESLRRQLGIVPQEGFLFAGTVAENIAFGRPDATREEIVAAIRAVGADEFIEAARGRLRHAARRARLAALARPAPARRVRARAARRPADPDPRRGDELGRHRHRAEDRAGAAPPAARPDGVHHRAPPLDDPRRRPDRRARARPGRRAGNARRAARAARPLHLALRRLGRPTPALDGYAGTTYVRAALSCQVCFSASQIIQR